MAASQVYQFRIALKEIEPVIWRRIQVPAEYSFWDLHVAVQDAMGWLDSHLHAFEMPDAKAPKQKARFGIPGELFDDYDDDETLPGWEYRIADYFTLANVRAEYVYDFGDHWDHDIVLEDILPRFEGMDYPRCVAGQRACPPEDVGGSHGYGEFLEAIADRGTAEHEQYLTWVGGTFDPPERFDPNEVEFDDPRQRWEYAFRDEADDGQAMPGQQVLQFEGFSPPQMHALIAAPFDPESSPLQLRTALPDEAFEAAPFVRDSARYLQMLSEREPLKLTQRGNLPRRFVLDLVEAGVLSEDDEWFRYKLPSKEGDSQYLHILNLISASTGLTRKVHGKLLLTKKGTAFATGGKSRGELFRHLFEFCARKFNWGYSDGYPESQVVQAAFAYSLFLLQRHGDEKRPPAFYAERFRDAFPLVLRDFLPGHYRAPEEDFTRAYGVRTFTRFAVRFGLALQEEVKSDRLVPDILVHKGPLLDRVVTWTEGAEGGSEPSVLAGPWQEASATTGSLRPADPNIETALDEFLVSQLHLRSPATICRYEEVLDLLGDYLDGYAHEQLGAEEHAFFVRHYEAEGDQQRDFCELFGPDKIPPAIDEFLNFFMTSKVMGSGKLKKTASSLCKKLTRWLQEQGGATTPSPDLDGAGEGANVYPIGGGEAASSDFPEADLENDEGVEDDAGQWEADDERGARMVRKGIHEAVQEQLASADPPEAREALERLVGQGYAEADARALIGRVLAGEMFEIMKQGREHDPARYARALKALPRLLFEE